MLIEYIPFIFSFFALIIASISLYKAFKMPEIVEREADNILNTLDNTLQDTLKPIQENISKSYSHKGTLGANAKQLKALDSKIAQDVINMQDPMIKAALDMFPNVKEYVGKNPNLLMELLPRIQQLQQIPDFKITDLVSPSLSTPSLKSPSSHPFGNKEE